MAVRLSGLRAGSPLSPPPHRKIPGTHFCYRLSQPQGHIAAGRIHWTEKSNYLIWINFNLHSVPEISTESSRASTRAENKENSLYKHWNRKCFDNELEPFEGVPELVELELTYASDNFEGNRSSELTVWMTTCLLSLPPCHSTINRNSCHVYSDSELTASGIHLHWIVRTVKCCSFTTVALYP
jgi:hypothetical protein